MTHSPVLAARELRWQTRLYLAGTCGHALLTATLRAPHALRQEEAYRQVQSIGGRNAGGGYGTCAAAGNP